MAKKIKLTYEEHDAIGSNLQGIRDYLFYLTSKLYTVDTKSAKKCNKTVIAVDELRSLLDDVVCSQFTELPDSDVISIYYRHAANKPISTIK